MTPAPTTALPPLPPLRSRRRSVVLLYAGWVVFCVGLAASRMLADPATGAASPVVLAVLLLVAIPMAWALRTLARAAQATIPDPADEAVMDERLLALRDRAHYRAYRIVLAVTYATWLGYFIAFQFLEADPVWARRVGGTLLVSLSVLLFTLPSAILAWQEPDDPAGAG